MRNEYTLGEVRMLVDILAIHLAEMRKINAVVQPSPQGHIVEETHSQCPRYLLHLLRCTGLIYTKR